VLAALNDNFSEGEQRDICSGVVLVPLAASALLDVFK
jgi:hypothetical protein